MRSFLAVSYGREGANSSTTARPWHDGSAVARRLGRGTTARPWHDGSAVARRLGRGTTARPWHVLPGAALQDVGGAIREPRALAARERDVPRVRPALHAIDDVGEARAALGQVRRVDLRDVAQAHDLGSRPRARDQRLHLLGRQVLRLVDHEILV